MVDEDIPAQAGKTISVEVKLRSENIWILILLSALMQCHVYASFIADCPYSQYYCEWDESEDTIPRGKRIFTTLRIQNPPEIDGKLTDDCWKLGEWQSNYAQYTPVYNAKAHYKTELKVLYNDKSIFVAIRAYDEMDKITRRLGRRDNFSGDIVGVHFDSYYDRRTAFEFDITSAGQKLDIWIANDAWDVNWNAVWYAKVNYEDSSWTAEFEIPLSQLRYGTSQQQVWGFNSWRLINRLQEENHWNLVANDGTGLVYTFGELHGLTELPESRRIEILPYVSGKLTTAEKSSDNFFNHDKDFKLLGGIDAKIGLSNNFTLDATINPDFGQVESDPSVMNLSAFETYFEEKRPFFIEGKNIFEFTFDKDQLFYTRRIGQAPSYKPNFDTIDMPEYTTIGGAVKLSGKTSKGLSIGLIEAVTLKEDADIHYFENAEITVEPLTNYFIGRFQQDFDRGNTLLGGIFTYTKRSIKDQHLNFLSRNALTYGADFTKFWSDRQYYAAIKAIGSHIFGDEMAILKLQTSSARYYQRPDLSRLLLDSTLTSLSGFGGSLIIGKWSKGHWRYNEEVIMRTPGLELNDLGYMPLSNIIKNNTNISYIEKNNQWIFKTYSISLLQQNAWNTQGKGLHSLFELTSENEFKNSWLVRLSGQYQFRTLDEQLLRGGVSMKVPDLLTYNWLIHSNSSKKLYVSFSGASKHKLAGNSRYYTLCPEIGYRPWSNLVLSLQSVFERDLNELQYLGYYMDEQAKPVWLLGTVDNRNSGITIRLDLAITPELTIQYYGSPFVSIGRYTDFKIVTNPLADKYSDRFNIITHVADGPMYHFDRDDNGVTDFSIDNPDFNYQQFRSNLVLRWEYKAGSTLYFVWAQDRTAFEPGGAFSFENGYHSILNLSPKNIFMVKFNYWFPI